MLDPRAFVSFDYDYDLDAKILFAGQATSTSPTPFVVHDWSSKTPLPQAQWEALIRTKISQTNMLIVLVGQHMATAVGVEQEIAMAQDLEVPFFGVYVNGANTLSTLPAGLAPTRTIGWQWVTVANAVDQMMAEGKNAP